MRKIFYPLFLLALAGTIGYFFWSDLSSFWQKSLLVASAIAAFFVFKGLLLSIFSFLFDGLSTLLKWIVSLLLFALISWGLWSFLPQGVQDKFMAFKSTISSQENIVTAGAASIANAAESVTSEISQTAGDIAENGKDGVIQVSTKIEDTTSTVVEKTIDTAKNITTTAEQKDTIKNEEVKIKTSPQKISETVKQQNLVAEKTVEESGLRLPKGGSDDDTSTWKKPVIKQEPTPTEIAKNSQTSLQQMKIARVPLVSSGESDEKSIVAFLREDAQIVYPADYTLQDAVFTDPSGLVADQLEFTVFTPEDVKATIQISIVQGGGKHNYYAPLFASQGSDTENIFYISGDEKGKIVYTTFFEGKLWDITILLPSADSEEDFYDILKPIRFEKRD